MRHKVFCSKTKSALLLTVIAAIITSVVLTAATSVRNVHAVTDSNSVLDTAHKKLWYQALHHCLQSKQTYPTPNNISSGKIFTSGAGYWSHESAYLETQIAGSYSDGKIACDQDNAKLLSEAERILGFDTKQLMCEYKNGSYTGKDGFLLTDTTRYNSCSEYYDYVLSVPNKDQQFSWTNISVQQPYLESLITETAFGGTTPDGGLLGLTPLEKYYVTREAYLTTCTTGGSPSFTNTDLTQRIYTWNSSTNRYELGAYSSRSNDDTTVYVTQTLTNGNNNYFNGSCAHIRDNILNNPNSAEFKAFIDDYQKTARNDCNDKYSVEYNKIKDWYSNNASKLDATAQADVNDILSKYNPSTYNGGKAWTQDSDGINIKCSGLEALSQDWSVTKGRDSLTDAPDVDDSFIPTSSGAGTISNNGVEATCHTAAKALGWILCPVLELSASATQGIYENYIEPSLVINHNMFNPDDSISGTHDAWAIFRDMANIVFVILILIVIFSQVTGVGIDNYGIKKILPKLIIAAILVNLSFYICQFAIDLSNIVGSSVYDTFNGINIGVSQEFIAANGLGTGGYTGSIITTVAIAIGGAAIWGVVADGAAVGATVAGFFLSLVPAILGALVSVLFLFVLLAMRQALVVILVVLSPLAFVCYMLPNTKSLYDRWLNLMRGMLILYPTCAVLMGGGRLVSRILLSSGGSKSNPWLLLVAMAAEIAPLFFVPTVVRGAYRATGALGATLNNLRGRWANGLAQRAGNSNTMRYLRQQNQNARANTVINRHRRRYGGTTGAITPPTGGLRRAVYGIRNMGYQQAQGVSAGNISQLATIYRDSDKATVDNELNDALKKLDPQRFVAAFRDLLQKGGREEALTALYNNAAVMNDPTMRASIEREMGSSGDTFMKEYTKYKASGGTGDFKQFIDTGALAAQLNAKGETSLANADKDVYAFMAHVAAEETKAHKAHTAFSGLNANVVARAATSLSSSDQAAKFNTFVTNMSYTDAQQQSIVNEISTADTASMFDGTREALSTAAPRRTPTAQVQRRFDRQFNGSIDPATGARNPDGISSKDATGNYANNGLRSRMSAADIAKYGL
ncbi:hypothetical protein IKG20_01570 [Candidatus Saccharibacteria bacterium]|nr:hypothetical protein [Candidatus Saccharibacteria bacterium]